MMLPTRSLFNFFDRRHGGPHTYVMVFHRVLRESDHLFPEHPTASEFELLLRRMKTFVDFEGLNDIETSLGNGRRTGARAVVTFDDGYLDNLTVALPVLKKLNIPATFFVSTAYLDGGLMFNDVIAEAVRRAPSGAYDLRDIGMPKFELSGIDQRRLVLNTLSTLVKYRVGREKEEIVKTISRKLKGDVAPPLMMTPSDLVTLAEAGMEIGSHLHDHEIVSLLTPEEMALGLEQSVARITSLTGKPPVSFAYPNGKPGIDYRTDQIDLLKKFGFKRAVSTLPGAYSRDSDTFQIPRVSVRLRSSAIIAAQCLSVNQPSTQSASYPRAEDLL
jgi:peptidoglycan/xylan/chitin deacetylase (PgdA/CDA1 family)